MKKTKLILFTLLSILSISCEDEVELATISGNAGIVVYGEISNRPGPYRIRIINPTDYGNQTVENFNPKPIENAQVVINDDAGNSETLMEEFPGVYVTKKNGIRGIEGRKYTLSILAKGVKYLSASEKLPAAPIVDSVYNVFNYASKPKEYGHHIYVKVKDQKNIENNYLIRHSSLNEFMVDQRECYGVCPPIFLRCWTFEQSSENIFTNDQFIDGQSFTHLVETPLMNEILNYGSHIAISNAPRKLFNYWKLMDEQSRLSGSIFDKVPAQIQGNIKAIDSENEALGYFAVIGKTDVKYLFDRYKSTPLEFATKLVAYNADFRRRRVVFDCRTITDWIWTDKYWEGYERKKPNNIGDKLPDWWYE